MEGIYKASMETAFYTSDQASTDFDCIVKFSSSELIIEYINYDENRVTYSGIDQGNGHYILNSYEFESGKATLHMFPDSKILEGSWVVTDDNGVKIKGFWKILIK